MKLQLGTGAPNALCTAAHLLPASHHVQYNVDGITAWVPSPPVPALILL